jgi:DNA-nicking Smr family endonuclease
MFQCFTITITERKGANFMSNSPVQIPINGVIDLHTFLPNEAGQVVDEYLNVCSQKGIVEVRIIHGKGKGVLRRTVEAVLKRHPLVVSFKQDRGPSGWGATVVLLKGMERDKHERKV